MALIFLRQPNICKDASSLAEPSEALQLCDAHWAPVKRLHPPRLSSKSVAWQVARES